jgi:hypothetical protein
MAKLTCLLLLVAIAVTSAQTREVRELSVVLGDEGLQAEVNQVEEIMMVVITKDGTELTWKDALAGLRARSPALRNLLTKTLAQMPFSSFKWECAPLSRKSMDVATFEFVVHDYPGLATSNADPSDFSEYLREVRGQEVARQFPNIKGDCTLVSPAQAVDNREVYGHIGSFLRQAPEAQHEAQWRQLGEAIHTRLSRTRPSASLWVSTAGGAVPWLHMRVDSAPKYYRFRAYRDPVHGPSTKNSEL